MGWNAPSVKLMNDIIVGCAMSEGRATVQRHLDRLKKQADKPHKVQRQTSFAPEMEQHGASAQTEDQLNRQQLCRKQPGPGRKVEYEQPVYSCGNECQPHTGQY